MRTLWARFPWAFSPAHFRSSRVLAFLLFVMSACGDSAGQKGEQEGGGGGTVDVTGVVSEWMSASASSSYRGAVFVLFDAETQQVRTATLDERGAFVIPEVSEGRSYYGLLLGTDYRLVGRLELGAADSPARLPVFRLGESRGDLGMLTVNQGVLQSSKREALEPELVLGKIAAEPVAWDQKRPKVTSEFKDRDNPDIDSDGLPNAIDGDVDGDDLANVMDPKTFSDTLNEDLPPELSFATRIPDFGYLSCSYLVTPQKTLHRCTLQSPEDTLKEAKLKTFGTEVAFKKSSAGAGDQVWVAEFDREATAESLLGRLALVEALQEDGTGLSYLTHLGDFVPFGFRSVSVELRRSVIRAQLDLSGWTAPEGTRLELILSEGGDGPSRRVLVSSQPVTVPTTEFSDLGAMFLSATPESRYQVRFRLIGPGPLPGLLGSGVESEELQDLSLLAEEGALSSK